MPFSSDQRGHFLTFLKAIDVAVVTKLPPKEAGDFFSILTDYSVADEEFEMKIAVIFYKVPEMLDELRGSIKNLSVVREAMLDDNGANADEARDLTLDFFSERVDELFELAYYEEIEGENELNAAEKKRRNDRKSDKRRMEKELQVLQEERQIIFEVEKEERKKHKDEKKTEESVVQGARQKEHEISVKERKVRKAKIEEQIADLQHGLQIQHGTEADERKSIREEKLRKLKAKQEEQQVEQNKQASKRKNEKEQEAMMMQARQIELTVEQEKQSSDRREIKLREEQSRANAVKAIQEVQSQERAKRKGKKKLDEASRIVDVRKDEGP